MQKKKTDTGDKTEATASEGEELYQQSRVGRHGKDLEGVSKISISKRSEANTMNTKLKALLKTSSGNMPKGLVDDNEAAVIAKWLSEKK